MVWLEREFLAGRRTVEHRAGTASKRVFDVDDAIFLSGEAGFSEAIASECAAVIAGNAWLAEHYRPHARRVFVVPTAVDPAAWAGGDPDPADDRFIVGWTGTSANFRYLLDIEEPLAAFLAGAPRACVRVVADRPPPWRALRAAQMEFVPWSVEAERRAVRGMDVGLMPLADEPWARGKCAAKMLVYMAAGLPCVAAPVGVNGEILAGDDVGIAATAPDQWLAALERLHGDRDDARAKGARGLAVVHREFSVEVNAARLEAIFRTVAAGGGATPSTTHHSKGSGLRRCDSRSRSSARRSVVVTMPTRVPAPSTTGRQSMCRPSIVSMTSQSVLAGWHVMGTGVITAPTSRSGTSSSPPAPTVDQRSTSRSLTTPTRDVSSSTGRCRMEKSCMVSHASRSVWRGTT